MNFFKKCVIIANYLQNDDENKEIMMRICTGSQCEIQNISYNDISVTKDISEN